MVAYYARRAAEYERIYDKPERQQDLSRVRELVECRLAGAQVLELACGTGYWTAVAARSAASVLATDINEEVLAIARSKAMGPGRVTFRQEDAYRPAGPAGRFGCGFAAFWWSHVPRSRLREFLRGFHRVLAPGSTVLFIDNTYVAGSSTPISREDDEGNSYQWRTLGDGTRHEVLKNFPSEPELRAAIEGLGGRVWIEWLQYYWCLGYVPRARE